MSARSLGRLLVPAASLILVTGCSVLDEFELGGSTRVYDPTKVYLKEEFITVKRHSDMDRYVCLSGPLHCEGFGQIWDCACFQN